ncbi:MAG: acetyl-CoA carboxylase biotin carboxyl carrier protein [Clostridium sp.]|nr:acetyl-CoA carboxylase biotin carboxyl carrier protein [Clostridium sp.]
MNIDEILTLVQAVSDSSLTSFKLEQGDTVISLRKEKEEAKIVTVGAPAAPAHVLPAPETVATSGVQVPAGVPAGQTSAPAEAKDAGTDIGSDKVITSPLVGTFYSSSSPDAEPYVKAGDTVKKGQILGIIEAMKLMNEIESEYDGVVEAVLVNNEDVVEYGQPLFRIK